MKDSKHKSKRKHRKRDLESSSSSSSEYEWKETSPSCDSSRKTDAKESEQSTWINDVHSVDQFIDIFSSNSKSDKKKALAPKEEVGMHKNELNPYWKDGGAGIPTSSEPSSTTSKLTDANRSWLYKSYKGCVDEANRSGENVRDILLKRWDSATVEDMLQSFERRSASSRSRPSHNRPRWRKTDDSSGSRPSSTPYVSVDNEPSSEHVVSKKLRDSPPSSDRQSVQEESSRTDAPESEERYVTDEDINSMAAKVMRAELASDPAKVTKLKANLEKLREGKRRGLKVRMTVTRKASRDSNPDSESRRCLPLTRLDDSGREAPVHIPNLLDTAAAASSRSSTRLSTHDSSGQRVAYLPGDTKEQSINDMLLEERYRTSGDMQREFSRLAAKSGRRVEDEYADAFVAKRSNAQRDAEHLKRDAVAAYKRRSFAESSCATCLERVPKHLIVSLGEKVFLALPGHVSLLPGYCLLTPYEHTGSLTRTDESTLAEVVRFKRQLMTMCREQLSGSGVVFIETASRPESARSHAQIECLPVPRELVQSVPGYFKKALGEVGSEWADNRKLISLSRPGAGAYGAVPAKFGYFCVEFGLTGGGLARIVHDDNHEITPYFGREVIAGLMEKDHHLYRKPKPESFEALCRKVVEFESWWEPYNLWSQLYPKSGDSLSTSDHPPTAPTEEADPVLLPEGPALPSG